MFFEQRGRVAWFLLPFVVLWSLLSFILGLTGRIVIITLGLALMIVGGVLTVTILGAPIGIPIIIIGFLLALRGIF